MKNQERPDYKFELEARFTKWKGYTSFPNEHEPLRKYLPKDYTKLALQLCDGPFETGYVWAVANGKRYNKEIEAALAWMAIETVLTKMFQL